MSKNYIKELKNKIDNAYKQYEKGYLELWEIMESWNYDEKEMKKRYEDLDKKSWVNEMLEELYYLKTKDEDISGRG